MADKTADKNLKHRPIFFHKNLPDPVRLAEYNLSGAEAKILWYVAIQCVLNPDKNYAKATNEQLAYILSMSYSTVKSAISNLTKMGLIKIRTYRSKVGVSGFYSDRRIYICAEILASNTNKSLDLTEVPLQESCTERNINARYFNAIEKRKKMLKKPLPKEELLEEGNKENDYSFLTPEERAAKLEEDGLEF